MNHYKTLMLVMFFLSIFAFSKVHAIIKDYSLLGKVIYLDAGHGGRDAGAISNTFMEKEMNLLLAKKLEKELTSKGALVYQTREGDYDLSQSTINKKRDDLYRRVKLINNSKADLYISIHLNSSPSNRWNGIQVFYSDILKENKKVAQIITDTMKQNMNNVREYKKENNYYMYSKLKIPGVLIETGFISNKNDNYKIRQKEYQDILIRNISKGIDYYFNK